MVVKLDGLPTTVYFMYFNISCVVFGGSILNCHWRLVVSIAPNSNAIDQVRVKD